MGDNIVLHDDPGISYSEIERQMVASVESLHERCDLHNFFQSSMDKILSKI